MKPIIRSIIADCIRDGNRHSVKILCADRFSRQLNKQVFVRMRDAQYLPPGGNVINLSAKVPSTTVNARSEATWQSVFSLVTCRKS